ncbi:MAG TPA: hypothetical protein VE958_02220 [Bryobacteraceae bacterium]|nr:hypothetical protein [Bryobacteraceae bacterium]
MEMLAEAQVEVDGRTVTLPTGLPGIDCAGGFAFGLYKAGSTLLLSAIERLTTASSAKAVNVLRVFHDRGVFLETASPSESLSQVLETWLARDGILFFGWRAFPTNYRLPLRPRTRTFLLLRDPRDMIVSHYFSIKYSHTTEGPGADHIRRERQRLQTFDLDSWALTQIRRIKREFLRYEALDETTLKVCRYEDVVFDKVKLLDDLCSQFGLDVRQANRKRIALAIDRRPEREDIYAHIRQVVPGDHRRKLKPSTIEQLNHGLADILCKYGYALEP